MALSPFRLRTRISCIELSSLLAGTDEGGIDHSGRPSAKKEEWRRTIIDAAKNGSLKPCDVEVHGILDGAPPVLDDESYIYAVGWDSCSPDEDDWKSYSDNELRLTFKRTEIYSWLKASGIEDGKIPEELHVQLEAEQPSPKDDLHPKRRATYQRVIAALIALQYGEREIAKPFQLAEEMINDCQSQDIKFPASRSTLGELFQQLAPVQKANPD